MAYGTRREVNRILGRKGTEYIAVGEFFEHPDGLKGVTGSSFCPITRSMLEQAEEQENLEERFYDLWVESVKSGSTEQSLADFARDIYRSDGYEALYDLSYYDLGEEAARLYNARLPEEHDSEDEAEFSECIGGGRMFNAHTLLTMDEVYDPELLKEVAAQEGIDLDAKYVIRSKADKPGSHFGSFWNAESAKWVHIYSATFYTEKQKSEMTTLPDGGEWMGLTK